MHTCKFFGGRRPRQAALCGLAALVVTLGAGAYNKHHQPVPAPVISGTPLTSDLAGQAYSFTPTASGPAGYTLTFSISGKPAWATFNAATGQLAGTPTAASVGTYSNIVISVSDGITSASLAAFTITVNQISNGSATVTWTPPTQNSDSTVLTNLAGYRIYYGNAANSLTQRVDLANAGLTAYTVDNLSTATWYFGVTAYTTSGAESALSNLGSKTIP